ncbi:MAG: LacI family transcriptional regulator [Oscillospiraceae bacterium]|jgi:DNA-binding LacI/PurR family transcriptional regulator|nr:LacI family transcriptional regulator [Oscillospiraceae bacterium]
MDSKKPGKSITIYDIASEAGVSPATVSRVMTKSAGVSESKRRAVEHLIQKYEFRPNALAKSLSNTHTHILGLLVADIRNPYFAALAVECEKAANRRGYTVMLCNVLNDNALEDSNLEKLYEQRVDAIIQAGCRVDDLVTDTQYAAHVNRVSRTIPFITTGKLDGTDCYCLNIDDTKGMKIIIDYLVSLGHRRIAMIGGENRKESTYEKWRQYIYLMGKNDLVFRDDYLQEGSYSEKSGYRCMNRLLDLDIVPTAVIAVNDFTAVGALKAAAERGVRIPQDISVISFDNTFLSEISAPKLTTIDYNYKLFGEKLVDTAIGAVEHRDIPKKQLITPSLVVRDSCADVNQKKE